MFKLPRKIEDQKIVLVALNWGDGHVMRCVPIVKEFLALNNDVVIFGNERQEAVFQYYFNELKVVYWKGFDFNFSPKGALVPQLLLKHPKLSRELRDLQKILGNYCVQNNVDVVFSDHIYRLNFPGIESIFITHQVSYCLPWVLRWMNRLHEKEMAKFSEVWVLDKANNELAGFLSEAPKTNRLNIKYLGWPSRFCSMEKVERTKKVYLLTGPEPFRSQLLNTFIGMIDWQDESTVLVGLASKMEVAKDTRVVALQRNDQKEIDEALRHAKTVYSRGGYTTYLDQKTLGYEMVNFPTPGQTEQIYLNIRHKKKASK